MTWPEAPSRVRESVLFSPLATQTNTHNNNNMAATEEDSHRRQPPAAPSPRNTRCSDRPPEKHVLPRWFSPAMAHKFASAAGGRAANASADKLVLSKLWGLVKHGRTTRLQEHNKALLFYCLRIFPFIFHVAFYPIQELTFFQYPLLEHIKLL